MIFGVGPIEAVILTMLGVGVVIWLGIPATLVYAGIAKSRGALRAILLSAAGIYLLLLVIPPLVGILAMASSARLESSGWSRIYHTDGSCTERTHKNGESSSVFHPQCPVPGHTR
jgi:hypothetical protein